MSKHILIIDDDPVVRLLLGECLKVNGFEIDAHGSGVTAIDKLKSSQSKPDLIFVDLMMPDMTGFEVINKIKETTPASNTPIILLSAISDHRATQAPGPNKPDRCLEKPWDMTKLLETISELIGK